MTTRDKLLDAAAAHFSRDGFERVPIASIAEEVGVTKQALLHHFGTKQKLYAEVLDRIARHQLDASAKVIADGTSAQVAFSAVIEASYRDAIDHTHQTRLLMRELLDNESRAKEAKSWALKPVLERLIDLLLATPAWQSASRRDAATAVYQLLGAVNYYAVSRPTLREIFGHEMSDAIDAQFPMALRSLTRSVVENLQEEEAL